MQLDGTAISEAKATWLQQVLGVALAKPAAVQPAAPAGARTQTPVVTPAKLATFTKSRMAWLATRKKVETDMDKLQSQVLMSFQGHSRIDDLEQAFRTRVETVLTSLDEQLAQALDDACKAEDPATHTTHVQTAQDIIKRYESYVATDETIAALDKNPFVPLAIQKTFTATLTVLSKSVV
jgi:hypothetical protein